MQQQSATAPVSNRNQNENHRLRVRGKFFFDGDDKLYVRGVTYGTFHPDEQGAQFPPPQVVNQDFRQMAAVGINAVRVYTPPPVWLLDGVVFKNSISLRRLA